jgi:hypothetical protein
MPCVALACRNVAFADCGRMTSKPQVPPHPDRIGTDKRPYLKLAQTILSTLRDSADMT